MRRPVAFTDFVPSDLVYRDRTGEIYRVRYNPAHRWFCVPEVRVNEARLMPRVGGASTAHDQYRTGADRHAEHRKKCERIRPQ